MSDEVINSVIIEEMQSCDSAVPPAALPQTQGSRAPAGMKKQPGEKTRKRCVNIGCTHSLLLYPRIHPFSDPARRKVTNETPVILEDELSAKLVKIRCSP